MRVLVRYPRTKSINSRTILIRLSKGARKLFSIDMYHARKESRSTIATRLARDQSGPTEFLHHYQYIFSSYFHSKHAPNMAFNSQGTGPKHTGQDRDDNHSTYASRGKSHMLCL